MNIKFGIIVNLILCYSSLVFADPCDYICQPETVYYTDPPYAILRPQTSSMQIHKVENEGGFTPTKSKEGQYTKAIAVIEVPEGTEIYTGTRNFKTEGSGSLRKFQVNVDPGKEKLVQIKVVNKQKGTEYRGNVKIIGGKVNKFKFE